jgi:anthranilate/para-aminobenzoate synthase component I
LLDRLPAADGRFDATGLRSSFTREQHEAAVARVIDYIAAGDIFQANLTQRFTADFHGERPLASRALFHRLAAVSPAWYGAYLELTEGRALASTSPELFLEVDPLRNVVTRPIKGTRPASVPAEELRRSAKDTAELNMIVDLLRNDIGRVCSYGSVKVPEPRTIESHPTVHHGVATVVGQLHETRDTIDLLRATMPGGSITGAPKVRAMEIIEELEPVRRGPYCGAIGYLSAAETCLNIAIRTLAIDGGTVDFGVGGGIVADSVPAMEYQETLDKAAAMMRALGLERQSTGR